MKKIITLLAIILLLPLSHILEAEKKKETGRPSWGTLIIAAQTVIIGGCLYAVHYYKKKYDLELKYGIENENYSRTLSFCTGVNIGAEFQGDIRKGLCKYFFETYKQKNFSKAYNASAHVFHTNSIENRIISTGLDIME